MGIARNELATAHSERTRIGASKSQGILMGNSQQRLTVQPLRVFRTSDGARWTVRMYRCDDSRDGKQCLIFECDGIFRRVRRYPDDWQDLDDEELKALSWST